MKALLRAVDRRLGFGAARLGRPRDGALPALAGIRRALIVRLDSIGDMVLMTPFLRELRRNLPQSRTTLVVRPAVHDLVARCPYVDDVLTWAGADARPRSVLLSLMRARRFARRHVQDTAFDLAVLPRLQDDAGCASVLAIVAGAPCRVGYHEPSLLTHVCPSGAPQHEVVSNLDVLRQLGGTVEDDRLELWLDDADRQRATALLSAHGAGAEGGIVAIGPGAAHPGRRWSMDRFTKVAAWSLETHGGVVLVVGGPEDAPLGAHLRERIGPRVINAAGRATLRESAALLARCRLFIGNDSGPMHLAAAAGVPVVEISCHPEGGAPGHPNAPARFRPWGVPHRIAQPGLRQDITGISAASVIAQAADLLARPG